MGNAIIWTHEAFLEAVGRLPQDDELEVANCALLFATNHSNCGTCKHNMPKLMCIYCAEGQAHLFTHA